MIESGVVIVMMNEGCGFCKALAKSAGCQPRLAGIAQNPASILRPVTWQLRHAENRKR